MVSQGLVRMVMADRSKVHLNVLNGRSEMAEMENETPDLNRRRKRHQKISVQCWRSWLKKTHPYQNNPRCPVVPQIQSQSHQTISRRMQHLQDKRITNSKMP